jgi:hypothetical protein
MIREYRIPSDLEIGGGHYFCTPYIWITHDIATNWKEKISYDWLDWNRSFFLHQRKPGWWLFPQMHPPLIDCFWLRLVIVANHPGHFLKDIRSSNCSQREMASLTTMLDLLSSQAIIFQLTMIEFLVIEVTLLWYYTFDLSDSIETPILSDGYLNRKLWCLLAWILIAQVSTTIALPNSNSAFTN